ncbi:MAG: homoserine dehydrogenase [Acidimicrobiia bacterium]
MRVGIGILGGGNVGGSLARKLLTERPAIAAKSGLDLHLVRVAVRSLGKPRPVDLPAELLSDRPMEVVDDPEVQLVVELMGGSDPARELILRALDQGKPVVTANKELVAADGLELIRRAEAKGVSLLFEAAVGGGIPILRPLSESLAGERLTRVLGIVNGTTNYILTSMEEESRTYQAVLAEAQRLGYAEADPTADVSGADAAAKAAILASLAFGTWVGSDRVHREGIESIQLRDLAFARRLGYVVKLLAVAEETPDGVGARVHPALVPATHPLASVRGAYNAVFVEGPAVGRLLFSGPGAGGEPSATAVLGDVIEAARELVSGVQVAPRVRFAPGKLVDFADARTKWYLRVEVVDRPGVLAQIAGVFGSHDVSIMSVWQEGRGDGATVLLVTHDAPESSHRAAVEELGGLEVVQQVAATIRVVTDEP